MRSFYVIMLLAFIIGCSRPQQMTYVVPPRPDERPTVPDLVTDRHIYEVKKIPEIDTVRIVSLKFYKGAESDGFDAAKFTQIKEKITSTSALYDSIPYPQIARRADLQGWVKAAFKIHKDSTVAKVLISESTSQIFDNTLKAHLYRQRICLPPSVTKPKKGKPKPAIWGVVEVEWKLKKR
jgi:hypothetical protein